MLWDSTIGGRGSRCTGKTKLHNLDPEDLRALTLATRDATDILLVGKH